MLFTLVFNDFWGLLWQMLTREVYSGKRNIFDVHHTMLCHCYTIFNCV